MTEFPIRCEACGTMARVPSTAVGLMAICPACRRESVVRAPNYREIPTVYPMERTPPSSGLLFGLAVSAFLIPLGWLLAKALGAPPPILTHAVPISLAIAAAGLGVGVALVHDWSHGLRIKLILAILALAWCLGATFFVLKAEWVEGMRRNLGLPPGPWVEFKEPSHHFYRVEMPGKPRPENVELVRGWSLEVFRFSDRQNQSFAFCVAQGKPEAANVGEDKFFADARDGAVAAANGTLVSEKPLSLQNQPGREYVIKLGDQATNRTVRVYRVGTRAVVAMVEGAFLPPDAQEVQKFFRTLSFPSGR